MYRNLPATSPVVAAIVADQPGFANEIPCGSDDDCWTVPQTARAKAQHTVSEAIRRTVSVLVRKAVMAKVQRTAAVRLATQATTTMGSTIVSIAQKVRRKAPQTASIMMKVAQTAATLELTTDWLRRRKCGRDGRGKQLQRVDRGYH
jgi:hypothetical protein